MSPFSIQMKQISRYFQNLFVSSDPKEKQLTQKDLRKCIPQITCELTSSVSKVFDDDSLPPEARQLCHTVISKFSELNEKIEDLQLSHEQWKDGCSSNVSDLVSKCTTLNSLIGCLRDDVFIAYLNLPSPKKIDLLNKNARISVIFSALVALEEEAAEMIREVSPEGSNFHLKGELADPEVISSRDKSVNNYYFYDDDLPKRKSSSDVLEWKANPLMIEVSMSSSEIHLDGQSVENPYVTCDEKASTSKRTSPKTFLSEIAPKPSLESLKMSGSSFLTAEDEDELEANTKDDYNEYVAHSFQTCRNSSQDSLLDCVYTTEDFSVTKPNLWMIAANMIINDPIISSQ